MKWVADGQVVGNEPMLSYRNLPHGVHYVRAEISDADGSTVYTQAFPVRPVGDIDGDYDASDDAICDGGVALTSYGTTAERACAASR